MPVSLSSDKFELKQWKFPGGEVGVKLEKKREYSYLPYHQVRVTGIVTSDDFFTMLNVISALHVNGVKPENISVFIPYLPYARQDRVCNEGESHALAVYLLALGTLQDTIGCFVVSDPHSEVSEKYLRVIFGEKLVIESQNRIVELGRICENTIPMFDAVVAPDHGAAAKAVLIQPDSKHVQLTKTREAGRVTTDISEDQKDVIEGTACIFDDICDGGATFLAAAKVLHETQPRMTSLSLYVTHGIFSQGVDKLLEVFDNIYVYNLMSADPEVAQKVKLI